jgi:hypothetical protein
LGLASGVPQAARPDGIEGDEVHSQFYQDEAMKHSQDFQRAYSTAACRDRATICRPVVPVYRVGESFHRGRRSWPEGAQFACGPGNYELTLFHPAIRGDLVDEVRRGPAEFALIVESPLIVLAYRFGESIPWNDVPYSWHLQTDERRAPPTCAQSPESRSLLWVTLVGSGDGVIHAQRGMTLSPPFTRALHEAICAQAMCAFDPEDCTMAISSVYLNYPATVDRLEIAAARTMGNA